MTKKHLILFALLAITLTLLLSGCGKTATDLEGKYVATFEMNGGTLDLKSFNVSTKINYAYDPGAHLIDPSSYSNYEISRAGYRFTGWYRSAECLESEKWNFSTDTINQESLVLYAGWVKEIVYTFSVCYTDNGQINKLGSYNVSEGESFEDYRGYASKRTGYTVLGYFADEACTIPWNASNVHPGGETDTEVSVFVTYIEGDWQLVDSLTKLKSAIGNGNIYLTASIDCGGETLSFGSFNYIFEGNGFTVSNFTVEKAGGALMPSVSIFQSLGQKADIRNVSFDSVTFRLFDVTNANRLKVSALAKEADGSKVTNVSVSGVLLTNFDGELSSLNKPIYDESSTAEITNFTSNITVEKQ